MGLSRLKLRHSSKKRRRKTYSIVSDITNTANTTTNSSSLSSQKFSDTSMGSVGKKIETTIENKKKRIRGASDVINETPEISQKAISSTNDSLSRILDSSNKIKTIEETTLLEEKKIFVEDKEGLLEEEMKMESDDEDDSFVEIFSTQSSSRKRKGEKKKKKKKKKKKEILSQDSFPIVLDDSDSPESQIQIKNYSPKPSLEPYTYDSAKKKRSRRGPIVDSDDSDPEEVTPIKTLFPKNVKISIEATPIEQTPPKSNSRFLRPHTFESQESEIEDISSSDDNGVENDVPVIERSLQSMTSTTQNQSQLHKSQLKKPLPILSDVSPILSSPTNNIRSLESSSKKKKKNRRLNSSTKKRTLKFRNFAMEKNTEIVDLCSSSEEEDSEQETKTMTTKKRKRSKNLEEPEEFDDPELKEEWKRMIPSFRTIRSLKRDPSVTLYLDYDKLFNAHLLRGDDEVENNDENLGSTGLTCSCRGKCMKNCDCKSLGEACNENCGCNSSKCTNKVSQLDRQKEEGYWITEGSRKKFITPDGDELTGRRAFSAYKKTSKYKGRRKKKKTKSKGRRRKRR